MSTFLRFFIALIFLCPFHSLMAESYFAGVGADYLNPRIERNQAGSSSFSTASESSYQYYGVLGVHMDRRKRHSFRGTYYVKNFELEAPSTRSFTQLEHDFSSYSVMYNYGGKSFDFYVEYLVDESFVFENQLVIGQFTPTLVKSSFVGVGLRFKAYSDKPHNIFSYNRMTSYRDSRGSKVSYSKGFRLTIDIAYFQQIESEELLGSEVEYSSKIKAGIQMEKGGAFSYGARINFVTENYEWANDSYSVLDFGGGVFFKINY